MKRKTKDPETMTEHQLLNELANRVIRYDKRTDHFIGFLQKALDKAGVDYESLRGFERLHMMRDEGFCQVREILRIVKKDKHLLWC